LQEPCGKFQFLIILNSIKVHTLEITLIKRHLQEPRRQASQEAAHLPHPRLQQGVRQDVTPPGTPPLAQRRAALRLQLGQSRKQNSGEADSIKY
jgi:hypothetical protein